MEQEPRVTIKVMDQHRLQHGITRIKLALIIVVAIVVVFIILANNITSFGDLIGDFGE